MEVGVCERVRDLPRDCALSDMVEDDARERVSRRLRSRRRRVTEYVDF